MVENTVLVDADALKNEAPEGKATPHWGRELLALLYSFETNDWQTIDMPDVVEWIKQQRLEQLKKRGILDAWQSDLESDFPA